MVMMTMVMMTVMLVLLQDTWVLTVTQALEWVRQPVPNANATTDYPPWSCL